MKRYFLRYFLPLVAIGALLIYWSWGTAHVALHKSSRLLMGTLVEVTVTGNSEKARAVIDAVFQEMQRVEDLTSFHTASELARVNGHAGLGPIRTKSELVGLVVRSLDLARSTNGAFDPTVGPLCRLWQFSAGEPRLPAEAEIAATLPLVGWNRVQVDAEAGVITLPEKGMALDLGAMAKIYALGRAKTVITRAAVRGGLVNAGGDIMCVGEKSAGTPWRVGIQHPRNQRGIIAVASVKDRFVVTSGDYQRSFIENGIRYHHILDPKTGFPATNLQSVTLVGESEATLEGLGTALFVMGPEQALTYLQGIPGVEGLLVDRDGKPHLTPHAREFFELRQEGEGKAPAS